MNFATEMKCSFIQNGYITDMYDEMWIGKDQPRPHWHPFIRAIEDLGCEELEHRYQEARRLLRENGVTYNVHGDPDGLHRPWELDVIPLMINLEDWAVIESGLIQRAVLFNLILCDLYGPRKLIREGLLPLELIYSDKGFLRQCDDIRIPGAYHLLLYAADLARGPDNRIWVLGDRTQAPSGAGYALENRMAMARILPGTFRDCKVRRLSNFFRSLRSGLAEVSPNGKENPRIVILTPGPHNETYFEHAYLAAYLGYTLVQGDDLTVRDGSVWLKTLDGLQPVDIILRRVDDCFCDPLELKKNSRLGVPGLLEASRKGNVVIANPLGSGVLENPGIVPFLPGIAKYFLGEDLILPSAAGWWCGQPEELKYVLDNLDTLIIKNISRQPGDRSLFGDQLSKAELDIWRARIRAHPYHYVGQEPASFSTTPSMINGRFEPRHAVLRCFLIARNKGYAVMPGGLTRSAPEKGTFVVSNQAGGVSKDTWVLASEPQKHISLWLKSNQPGNPFTGVLPSRAAENLFWVGRYAERAEAMAHLLRTILDIHGASKQFEDETDLECLRKLLSALTHLTATYPGFTGEGSEDRLCHPEKEILSVTLDPNITGSLISVIHAMFQSGYGVRNLWSTDTWRVIEVLEPPWTDLQNTPHVRLGQIHYELNQLISTLMAFAGLSMESMTRESGWYLLDIGRRLERALLFISMLRSVLVFQQEQSVEHLLFEAVLTTTENLITYRRRYRAYLQLETVLEQLLLDKTNPRSLAYQINQLQHHIAELPREQIRYRLSEEERLILETSARLQLSDTNVLTVPDEETGFRKELDALLADLTRLLFRTSETLTRKYFSHAEPPRQLAPTTLEIKQ